MAKHNLDDVHAILEGKLNTLRGSAKNLDKIDLVLVDMLGNLVWKRLHEANRTEEQNQLTVLAALFAAYIGGRQAEAGSGLAKELFEFISELDIEPGPIKGLSDLMGW